MAEEQPAWAVHLPAGVDPATVDLVAAGSLPAAWARVAAAEPARPALWQAGRWLSRGELEAASRRVAGRLHRAGLRPADRVLFSAGTSLELAVAHVAALRLRLVAVPVNTAYREREVAHIAADAEPRAAVVDDPERAGWIRAGAGGGLVMVGPEVDLPDGDPPELDAAARDDMAMLIYTSGTTGAPKGAELTHGNLLAGAEAIRLAWRWAEDDRLLLALPLFHIHGLGNGLHGTLLAGASAVLQPRFEPDGLLDAVRDHGATLLFGVPTMYGRLAASPRAGELGALRLLVSGSAPLPASLFERLAEVTGHRVLERYGMTETMMLVSNPYRGERRPGTVGLPLPGVELRLEGDAGDVLVRGPNVFRGYWRNPAATAEAFTADGWFRTGDLGTLDDRGYLRLEGRSRELIITGGYNVYPREVEELLLTHPGVAEVAVVGTPSEEWGETVTAFVVAAGPPPARDELAAFVADRLAPYKRPRAVHYVDALPRNALGKVLKHQLCEPPPR
jgi:malonyl-CoA/methylmalonyl-CoA synthetase